MLSDALTFLAVGGSAYLSFWLLESVEWLTNLSPERKRYAAYALTAGIAVLAWLGKITMMYEVPPEGWRCWIESAYGVAAGSVIANQLLHARLSMKRD